MHSEGQAGMQSPHPMQAASSMVSPPPSATADRVDGACGLADPAGGAGRAPATRGSIHPLIPASFSSALMQLFGQPETPILNLCGAGFP